MLKRVSTAHWAGSGLEGSGTLNTTSGVFKAQPYSFHSRFKSEDGKAGTNPEELIAAAHAGCFSMALSFRLTGAGFVPDSIDTSATLTMENEGGWVIKSIHLDCTVKAKGISAAQFAELAEAAKANCPVSKVLSCAITLSAKLA